MDILFSPYAVGSVPKSAMVEIERRTEDLLKSSSFQRMLELEKKYKMERLRGAEPVLPLPQPTAHPKGGAPPRPDRPDSGLPQEQFLMVKATRRTIIPHSLSITIPQAADNESRGRPREWEDEQETEEYADAGTPTNSEPFQKQVKFLAPEDDDQDEEDAMSEQSSICQSPSWEGYGQRKKEKKREAERRRKEKEQAEKDAKAAKKRSTARLSKVPPPTATASRNSRIAGLTAADRSFSDPVLVTRHLQQSTQSIQRPEEVGRTMSADDIQQSRWHQPAVTEILSNSRPKPTRPGHNAAADPSPSAIPHHLLRDSDVAPGHELHRSMSEGAEILTHHSSSAQSRSPRDAAFPPSASRTPRLRHLSPSAGGRSTGRSNGVFQGPPSANQSQESLSAVSTADGTRRNGYVVHQRAQVAERAMAGLVDEQLVANAGHYYPPSRSSSGHTQHTRRSSLTQDAKSVAMKLVGMKTPSSARDAASQADYLTFKAIPYCGSIVASASTASIPSPRSMDGSFRTLVDERPATSGAANSRDPNEVHEASTAAERPATSQRSSSSNGPSITGSTPGSQSKKSRSLKDAAKAALAMSKGSQKPADSATPAVSLPPFLALRNRLHSRTSVHAESKTSQAVDAASGPSSHSPPVATVTESTRPKDVGSKEQYRASEGSSSSSAFEDGSPLPSPATTPDTSRPQSAKDVPLAAADITMGNTDQDEERTLRQSLDSSKSSTPRVGESETRQSIEVGSEDRWSRTALPIDIDCDAQSFMTTVSNFDNVDDAGQGSSNSPSSPLAGAEQPKPPRLESRSSSRSREAGTPLSIPPRSRKRSQSNPVGSPTPSEAERHGSVGTDQNLVGEPGKLAERPIIEEAPRSRTSRNFARPFQQAEAKEKVEGWKERHEKATKTARHDKVVEVKEQMDEATAKAVSRSPQRQPTSGSISLASSAAPSVGSSSPHALSAEFQLPSNPYFTDFPEPLKHPGMLSGELPTSTGPPSPVSLPSPIHPVPSKPPAQPRANSAPSPSLASTAAPSRASTPSARTTPVSILKQPKSTTSTSSSTTSDHRPQVLSALPKHMQLQQQRPQPPAAPIAKMFVECCVCKYYHDMPSKVYECMAKPDAVVEDQQRGIRAAITTMVKCPWCEHNMSKDCCSGYAAVVYIKEKLH